jgi:hypothetical protein
LQYEASTSTWKPSSASTFYSLNNLTASAQLLAIGTAGTAPAWNSLTSTHTLDIPMASTASVTAGLLSNADWTIFNTKVSSVAAGSQKITIGGTATAPTVDVDPSKLGTITLATTTTGADVSVTGSPANLGGTLTLNVPDASATARGVITTGTQTIAGNKIFSGSTTVFGSGEGGTPTATFLRGPQAGGTGTPGADLYIQASNGTGAGGSGNIIFQTGSAATVSVPTVSNIVNQVFGSSNTQTLSGYTVPSGGTNKLLMVEVNIGYNGPTVSSITYNGSALSQLGYITSNSNRMEIWYLVAPVAGASKDIVLTLTGYAGIGLTAMTWANVNQSTPFGTVVSSNNGYNSSASLLPTSSLGQVVMDFLTTTTSPVTATTGQTILTSYYNGSSCYNTSGYKAATTGTTTMSYSFANSNYGYMAFAIQSSTSGGGNALSDALTINNTGNTVIAGGKSLALADAGGNLVSLKAPSSVGAYTLTLPTGQGGSGQALINDGAGGLSWGSPASGYTLPLATTTMLGGVKVGSGLSVDAAGVISAATSGTVSSVSTAAANNGVTATWATNTTTPALTIGLGAITPISVNGLTLAAQTTGFTVAGGTTTSKTLTVNNSLGLSGTDGSTLNIGGGGTLGTNAYTSTAYAPLASPTFTGTVTNNGSFAGTAVLPAANGGTGQNSYAIGDLLYASTSSALSKLTAAAAGNALISGGAGTAPSWGKIDLATHVSGILPVANGGTGSSTQNWVDLTTNQTIAGAKTWSGLGTFNLGLSASGAALNLNGNSNFATDINTGTSTGAVNIASGTVGSNVITIGNKLGVTSLTQQVGTGGYILDGVGTATYKIGESATTGAITIGGTAQTGLITIGSSSAGQTVYVGVGTGLSNVTIGSSTALSNVTTIKGGNSVNAINLTPHPSGGVIIGSPTGMGPITIGSSSASQTVNIGIGGGGPTVNIGNSIAGATVAIASSNAQNATKVDIASGANNASTTVNIGTGVNTAGSTAVTIGSNADLGNTTTIKGGNGAGAISLTPQTTGTIVIGAPAGTGAITLGSSSVAQTVNVGTGVGASTVNIGSATAGSVVKIKSPLLRTIGPVITTSASSTLPAASMAKGAVFQLTGTTARTFTLDTGANLSAALPGVAAGDMISFVVSNASNKTLTMASGAGTTLANAMTIAALQSRTFYAINTGDGTWIIY